MDMTPAERRLLDAALEKARDLGLAADLLQDKPAREKGDAVVRLRHGRQAVKYQTEVKRALRPATLGAVMLQLERMEQPALLVTDYVTPPIADALRARRVAFLDAAGNAYLERPGLIWVKGQKPAAPDVPPTLGRAFQPTGLQVLFALLCNPALIDRPYRELGALAGVAHGTVGWVIPDLQQQGYIAATGGRRGNRRLLQADRLLAQWVDAYARQLRPRMLIGRYYVPTLDGWQNWKLAPHGALWGGEPGGALLTGHLRPGELTLYAEKLPGRLVAQQKFLKEPAAGHAAKVEVRRRFWNFPWEGRADVVPPILVYADLLATGNARCIETAKMVYDVHVARLLGER